VESEPLQSEGTLIRRFRDGDEEAFRILFDSCANALRARIEHWMPKALKRRLSVADVLQEVMIIAFEQRTDLEDRGAGSFRKWLLGITDLKARQAFYKHTAQAKRSIDREISRKYRAETAGYAGKITSPSQAAICSELKDLAKKAMNSLPEDYREVLHLTQSEHLTLREAAERMGRSREAMKKLYGRALREFTDVFNRMRGGENA